MPEATRHTKAKNKADKKIIDFIRCFFRNSHRRFKYVITVRTDLSHLILKIYLIYLNKLLTDIQEKERKDTPVDNLAFGAETAPD